MTVWNRQEHVPVHYTRSREGTRDKRDKRVIGAMGWHMFQPVPQTEKPVKKLWFRKDRSDPWRTIAQAKTSQELVNILAEWPESGEFVDLPAADHPNNQRRAAALVHPPGRVPV
jgi:hypothetical protein